MNTEEDYPRTLIEFERRFATEEACRAYLRQLRWPNGFVCPVCQETKGWPVVRGELIECGICHRQTSVTAGTIFEGTRKPITLWFRAMWYVTNQKTGVSAVSLRQALGLGSYQTAWAWLHKLRRAMVRPNRDCLTGRVEVDEAYIGQDEEGVHGRQTAKKALIVIAAEEDGRGMGRIRMQRVDDASAESLELFILSAVKTGAFVSTDGWQGYSGIAKLGYEHAVTKISKSGKEAHESMPRVHRVASLLKRWLLGTHQGAVSHEHIDYYLDEFTFRFNRRTSRNRGKLFYRLVQQATAVQPEPYAKLIGGKNKNANWT